MATDTLVFFLRQLGVDPAPQHMKSLRRLVAEAQLAERKRCIAYVEHCKESFASTPDLPQDISVAAETIREGLLAI